MSPFKVLVAPALASLARTRRSQRPTLRVAAVQTSWHADAEDHRSVLASGIRIAAEQGARIVCLQELTLSPYFATRPDRLEEALGYTEVIPGGATTAFAQTEARASGIAVHASLYERADRGLGYNTAICVGPDGALLARTRKMHIPCFPGYHEDRYFQPGDSGFPVVEVAGAKFAFPTCWDQWFPELARSYSLAGAEAIVYPTAIGSEPHLDGFDTQPLWEQMIRANGLANATFMIAVNRIGEEPPLRFYGSSFISDPYGRLLVQASRDEDTVIIADLDLDQRRDWLEFGHVATRRPAEYTPLTQERSRNAIDAPTRA
ncbi:MAG: hydrolase [Candidatus Eremiobacteraeota bacterium]|nr:hydrolase [Candidatus Eremiobacteraeota bacterium]